MTTLALQHKLKSVALPTINVKSLYLVGIPVLFLMLVFYIYSINVLTGGSYMIKGYNKQMAALQDENAALQTRFAASDFMGTVQDKTSNLGFEKTTQVTYIEVVGNSLAQAR